MKFYKIIILILVLVLTIIVSSYRPSLHKPFVLEKENFTITKSYQEPATSQSIRLMKIGDAPVEDSKLIVKAQNDAETVQPEVHIEPSEFYQIANKPKHSTEVRRPDNYQYQRPQQNLDDENDEDGEFEEEEIQEETLKEDSLKEKLLQRKEETIAWNKWRSDLQNSIMADSSVEAPLGTLFYFSFKVDNKRHISNIKVFCTNPLYAEKSVKSIHSVIKSYDGKSILQFPKKTNRKSVKFDGSFMIWVETEFSSPDNFNDFERVHYYE